MNCLGLVAGVLICSTAWAAPLPSAAPARPGTLNAITGEVWLNGMRVDPTRLRLGTLEAGGALKTGQGMAEVLLSPGGFLRLGARSEFTLEAIGTSEIKGKLAKGEALVEVLDASAALTIEQNGVSARLRKPGLYEFNEKRALIAVYAGESQLNQHDKQLIADTGAGVGTRRFRVFRTSSDPGNTLLSWSRSRSEQLSSESRASAQENTGAAQSTGPQWHWDPWATSYTFLSASGFVTGPFGWPYFSPGYAPDSIPVHRGDTWLYGPPIMPNPVPVGGYGPSPLSHESGNRTSTVPLTAPGEPHFSNNR